MFGAILWIVAYGVTIRDIGTGSTKVRAGRTHTMSCPGLSLGSLDPNGVGIIAFVGQQDVPFVKLVRQRVGLGAVGDLAADQTEVDGTPFGVDERVNFARKPAAGTAHASIVPSLFRVAACW